MRRSQKMIAVILLLTLMSSLCVYANDHSIIEKQVVVQKENALYLDLWDEKEILLTSNLFSGPQANGFLWWMRTTDARWKTKILFPSNLREVENDTMLFDLNEVDLTDKKFPVKRIDTDVSEFFANGEKVFYQRNSAKPTIYRYDYIKKEKILDGELLDVSENNKILVYARNHSLYKYADGQSMKIDDDLEGYQNMDSNLESVYYYKNNALYVKR